MGSWIYISSSRINLKSKKREITINYLIEAYQVLSTCCCQKKLLPELEKAVINIQLFGTESQIKLTQEMMFSISDQIGPDLEELLNDLRNSLRKELNLAKLDENTSLKFLNIKK